MKVVFSDAGEYRNIRHLRQMQPVFDCINVKSGGVFGFFMRLVDIILWIFVSARPKRPATERWLFA